VTAADKYLIDASAFWRIKRDDSLAAAWEGHLDRGLIVVCAPTELEVCRKASRRRYETYDGVFETTYLRVELSYDAGSRARQIQRAMVAEATNSGAGPVDLLVAATAAAYGYVVLHDDGDYDAIADVCNELRVRNVSDTP
jgi:predicted nucleic acid-binding protein